MRLGTIDRHTFPPRGALLMLFGPSAGGKTTLISSTAAILEQDSGNLRGARPGLEEHGAEGAYTPFAECRSASRFNFSTCCRRSTLDLGTRLSATTGSVQRWPAARCGHRVCVGARPEAGCCWGAPSEIPLRTGLAERASMYVQAILWLAVRPFGHMRSDPFQKKFANQIRHSIRTRARQTIEND